MAEPIGVASGLLTLAVFALNASQSLYQVIEGFRSNKKALRELKEELSSLNMVLKSLQESTAGSHSDFQALQLPLFRCGQTCKEFAALLQKVSSGPGGTWDNIRDWAKLQYMGGGIDQFKGMLAGYKATITIAVGDANFRNSTVTLSVLAEYKELITNTTSDLEDHLQEIERKLETRPQRNDSQLDCDDEERQSILEERQSIIQCLAICAQFSEHVDHLQPNGFEDVFAVAGSFQVDVKRQKSSRSAKRVTASVLAEFKAKLSNTIAELQDHLRSIDNKLQAMQPAINSRQSLEERQRIEEERESIKQCLAVCTEASRQTEMVRTNVFDDVSASENAQQVIVSTLGDLISATRVSAGRGATQVLGQMEDATVQQISRDRARVHEQADAGSAPSFADKYGAGHTLGSQQ